MYIMIQDKDTNFVYISNKLSLWKNYSTFCNELMSVMDELKIPYEKSMMQKMFGQEISCLFN